MQAANQLQPYFPLIAQCLPDNQARAATLLRNPEKRNLRLSEFFGAIFALNLREEALYQSFEKEMAQMGGSVVERVVPEQPSSEEWNKHWSFAKKAKLKDPKEIAALDEQIRLEVTQILSFLQIIRKVKKCLIEACNALSEAQREHDVAKIEAAKQRVRQFSQPVIFQDDARFGEVSADRKTISQNNLTHIFLKAVSELPQEWGLLAFEAWAKELPPGEAPGKWTHLRQLGRFLQCSGLVINFTMLDPLERELNKFFSEGSGPLDTVIGQMARTHHFYAIYPSVAYRFHPQEPKQAQPVLSPIDIQRTAAVAKLGLNKPEPSLTCNWSALFGSRFVVAQGEWEALRTHVQSTKATWEKALADYRVAQDIRIQKKTCDEEANKAYNEAENRRKRLSSIFIQFGDEPLPFENPKLSLDERKQAFVQFYETLANLPKDWECVAFHEATLKPCVNVFPNQASLTTLRALAVNYIGYEKLLL